MRAWQAAELGEPAKVMQLADLPDPEPGPRQLLVKVLAAPANFPDALMCRGLYQVKPVLPFTPGVELCGEVVARGSEVEGFASCDRALGAEVASRFGADVVVDRHREDLVEVVRTATGGRGEDVVHDPVGYDTYQRSTKCIAFEGRILVVGFAGGDFQPAALNHALVKSYSIVCLHWGLYNLHDPAAVQVCHRDLTELADQGLIEPLVSKRLSLDEVAAGVQRLAGGATVGRVGYDAGMTR